MCVACELNGEIRQLAGCVLKLCFQINTFCNIADYFGCGITVLNTVFEVCVLGHSVGGVLGEHAQEHKAWSLLVVVPYHSVAVRSRLNKGTRSELWIMTSLSE